MNLKTLKPTVEKISLDSSLNSIEKMQAICDYLQSRVAYYDWVGFYFAHESLPELHLKAQAGSPTDHTVIPFGKGICGQVAVSNKNFVVADVHAQDNYISCSIDVKSEIVIPLFKNRKNIGQIDIDSNTINAFSLKDEDFLEWVNQQVSNFLN